MAVIKVRSKIGNTVHPKYGPLEEGQELEIDEQDFGDEIFERYVEDKEQKTKKKKGKEE
jgi:hypothetical protein